jgi:16S rRNA processing protein RimM
MCPAHRHICFNKIVEKMMTPDDGYYSIGRIIKTHGLKGEVTVAVNALHQNDLTSTEVVFMQTGNQYVPYFIDSLIMKGHKAYVKFEGVNHIEDANSIVNSANSEIFLPKSVRPKLKKGEFYDDEVIGFTVEDVSAGKLGSISEVVQSGRQRLLSLTFHNKELLIPVDGPFIKNVDKQKRVMSVLLPEGFLEL